jgi:hypothetical protein
MWEAPIQFSLLQRANLNHSTADSSLRYIQLTFSPEKGNIPIELFLI